MSIILSYIQVNYKQLFIIITTIYDKIMDDFLDEFNNKFNLLNL
jgi:hypothetical protein